MDSNWDSLNVNHIGIICGIETNLKTFSLANIGECLEFANSCTWVLQDIVDNIGADPGFLRGSECQP